MYLAAAATSLLGMGWLATLPDPLDEVGYGLPVQPLFEDMPAPPKPEEAEEPSEDEAPARGLFHEARDTPSDEEDLQLEVLGYLSGSREATGSSEVTVHDERAWDGLNLYTSGHAPEAFLMDMEGEVLHRWSYAFDEVWPDWLGPDDGHMHFWRRVHLLPGGDLLAVFEGLGLIKLDRDSNLLWARPNRAHHDLEVLEDGTILVLTRSTEHPPEVEGKKRTHVDYITHLDAEGLPLERHSLLSAYSASPFAVHWRKRVQEGGDSFHTNALHRIDRDLGGVFQPGNLLLSMRHLHTIAIYDPDEDAIVYSYRGPWRLQHDPTLLANGNLLLFDNGTGPRKASRVFEVDRNTLTPRWIYEGTEDHPFWSATCGTAQRLPNGNTLITESDGGRAFEVTPDKDIVWEFWNPHRPPDEPELVATLFEVLRLPPDTDLSWLPIEPDETPSEPDAEAE